MEILRKSGDYSIIVNQENDFLTNLGWEEGMDIFEEEVLSTIINPIDNYETVRYIHKPYTGLTSNSGDTQCDIWYKFYFIDSGNTYTNGLDYSLIGIPPKDNARLLKTSTESFFRLEFFKSPGLFWSETDTYQTYDIISYGTNIYKSLTDNNVNNKPDKVDSTDWEIFKENETLCEPPTRINRKLVFSKNLSIPLGEKFYYNTLRQNIHIPVFMGSNYKNKENMYLFWFQDDTVLSDSIFKGNTFFMTAKFMNATDGSMLDFTTKNLEIGEEIVEQKDMYYKIDINKTDYSYKVYKYNGELTTDVDLVGNGMNNAIKFYEKR